jgi:hypothetical protein
MPATTAASTSTVTTQGTAKCPACKAALPVTKFPTARSADGTYVRSTAECRACRDARRAAKKAAKPSAK